MNGPRPLFVLGFAAALAASAAHGQGDQSDIISAHGDALARSTSTQALVAPMPKVPPNSALPVLPSAAPQASPAAAEANPAPPAAPLPPNPGNEGRRGVLIAAGALIALAMFLWDRRRKD